MKTLLVLFFAVGCGPKLPDCSDANYTSTWGICVYQTQDQRYNQAEVDQTLDLFFEGLALYTQINAPEPIKAFYRQHTTSLTLRPETNASVGLFNEAGDVEYSGNTYALTEYIGTQTALREANIAHELLHTIQFYTHTFDSDNPHKYPVDWFMDYDRTTGEFLPNQKPLNKLENKLSAYLYCNMDLNFAVGTTFCDDFR